MILDTHVWIWYLLDNEHLSSNVRKEIDASFDKVSLCAISLWEAALLIERERIRFSKESKLRTVRDLLKLAPIHVLPISGEIALMSREITCPHEDPADRFIAASAHAYHVPLITADKNLLKCKEIRCIRADR